MAETGNFSFNATDVSELARRIRVHVVRMTSRANSSHIGSSFSMSELLAVLYGGGMLRVDPARPDWPERDRFILSKGHGCAGLYAALSEAGFFPIEELDTFYLNGTRLAGHATTTVPGVELSTGSLGHGLPVGTGMALAAKRAGESHRVFVLLSDGECDEGSVWEAALFAPQHKLDNLVVIVDYNKIQSLGTVKEVMDLDPFADKWRSFRWAVREVAGHDVQSIREALDAVPFEEGRPSCIIAHTVKGKGVSFMEDKLLWHYRAPLGDDRAIAMRELGEE
jgi:transketolase